MILILMTKITHGRLWVSFLNTTLVYVLQLEKGLTKGNKVFSLDLIQSALSV